MKNDRSAGKIKYWILGAIGFFLLTRPVPRVGGVSGVEETKLDLSGQVKKDFRLHLVIALIVTTLMIVMTWILSFNYLEKQTFKESRVFFEMPEGGKLTNPPPEFAYDQKSKELIYAGVLERPVRDALEKLLFVSSEKEENVEAKFSIALDQLVYSSRRNKFSIGLALLFTAGLSGMLGVQLRSMFDFVGHACYKKTLDIPVWWPWYVIRPVSGFLLGALVTIFIQDGLWQTTSPHEHDILWWIGIAFLAGFGSDDFMQRVRQISQTLFGVSPKSTEAAAVTQENPK